MVTACGSFSLLLFCSPLWRADWFSPSDETSGRKVVDVEKGGPYAPESFHEC